MITDIRYLNPATGEWQTTPPEVNVGQMVGLAGYVENTTTDEITRKMDIQVTVPDGSVLTYEGDALTITPGYMGVWQFTWTCDEAGSYTGVLKEYEDSTEIDTWGPGLVATAEAVPASIADWLPGIIVPIAAVALLGAVLIPKIAKLLKEKF